MIRAANPYLQLLDRPEKWAGIDSTAGPAGRGTTALSGTGLTTVSGRDTATLSQIAYALYRTQGSA